MNVSDAYKEEEGDDHLTVAGFCCRLRRALSFDNEERAYIGPKVGLH